MDRPTLMKISSAIGRRWWLALLVLITVLAGDAVVTYYSPRSYLARTSLVIGPSARVEPGQLVYSVDALGRSMVVGTFAGVLTTDLVRREALARVGLPPDQPNSDIEIKSAAVADSALVQVTAVARDPDLAAALANAVGEVGEVQMSRLYPIYDLSVVTHATPPLAWYRPDVTRNLSMGVLVGVLLAGAAACSYDSLTRPSSSVRG
jgi:polysaccharide biosynthesis transport protein